LLNLVLVLSLLCVNSAWSTPSDPYLALHGDSQIISPIELLGETEMVGSDLRL
ncbi:hypothetical protein SK128_000994, partial [Halocaridina rubra]